MKCVFFAPRKIVDIHSDYSLIQSGLAFAAGSSNVAGSIAFITFIISPLPPSPLWRGNI